MPYLLAPGIVDADMPERDDGAARRTTAESGHWDWNGRSSMQQESKAAGTSHLRSTGCLPATPSRQSLLVGQFRKSLRDRVLRKREVSNQLHRRIAQSLEDRG